MTVKRILKNIFSSFGFDLTKLSHRIASFSINMAVIENGYAPLLKKLRAIQPDISDQESSGKESFNDFWELKRRTLQAFQCSLMLNALNSMPYGKLTVVDIGDSAGTHMLYLKELLRDKFDIDTISVNLDQRAIDKIKAKGLKALLCRAEELDLGDRKVDLFTSFQMVEHLHNPSIFFRRLAKKTSCNKIVVTIPFMKISRVGLLPVRNKIMFAEDVHIFELSPQDWTLLILHSGWRIAHSEIYYQYPKNIPFISWLLSWFWKETDFEGFLGLILEKDTVFSDLYQNWED
jgi:2-polyprenyl-3-methyl-5-hydroxy-6-metoxy-1,4-benzoquinol methylase